MPEPMDRRAAERMPVTADTSCVFVSPVVEDFGPAKIRNVSMDGIGLVLSRRLEPGALMAVSLSNPARNFARTMLIRVVHVTPEHGVFLVGGTFNTPLTYEELTTLVM
jgi:PilZ domain